MDDNLREFIFSTRDELILFHLLNDEEVGHTIPYLELVPYRAGSVLFSEGDPGGFIAFILSGVIEVKKQTDYAGKQMILGTLTRGSFIGETSLIDPLMPRAATAVIIKDAKLAILKNSALESLMQEYPFIGIKILKGLIRIITFRLLKALDKLKMMF